MKFTCIKENLKHALDIVSNLTTNNSTNLPILSNVLIIASESKVELKTTNLEIALKSSLRAKVEKEGSFTVPAKTLNDYVNLITTEQIEIELIDNELVITSGNSSTKIKGENPDDYPVIPNIEEKIAYALKVDDFRNSLIKTVVAVSKNEIRPELAGVYFKFNINDKERKLVIAATDSYRLAEAKIKIEQGEEDSVELIVPSKTIYELIRIINLGKNKNQEELIRIWVSDNQFAIRYNSFEMTSRLVDGKYPDYKQIIPQQFKTIATISVDSLINKIKAASIFSTEGVFGIKLDVKIKTNKLIVSSTSNQRGEHSSEIDCLAEGEDNSILLNYKYILDGLQHLETETEFCLNTADSPCLFRPKDNRDYLYIIMPIRQ